MVRGGVVELGRRLVGQHHRRSPGEGAGERQPLLLPAGQRCDPRSTRAAEPQAFQQFLRLASPVRRLGGGMEVVGHGQVRHQVVDRGLEHQTDRVAAQCPAVARRGGDRCATEDHPAARGRLEQRKNAKQRGLPGPRRSGEDGQARPRDGERDVLESGHSLLARGGQRVVHTHTGQFVDRGVSHAATPRLGRCAPNAPRSSRPRPPRPRRTPPPSRRTG